MLIDDNANGHDDLLVHVRHVGRDGPIASSLIFTVRIRNPSR
jgi:hypothetical protein